MLMNKDALGVRFCRNLYALGPDVLRVKPVEGWKRGKAFVFYPERCISDGACIGVCPTHAIFWMRPLEYTSGQPVPYIKTVYSIKAGKRANSIFHPIFFILKFFIINNG